LRSSAFARRWPGSIEDLLSSLQRQCHSARERYARAKPADRGLPPHGGLSSFGPTSAPAKSLPSEDPDVIASELDLSKVTNRGELQRLRRRFLWTNHPDRRPDLPHELANRRAAIANMLIDRALLADPAAARRYAFE